MCALVTGVQTCARPISVVLKALAGGALVGTIIAGLMLWWVAKQKPPLHGAARFAKEGEIRRAGFRADDGIVLGKKGGKFLTFGGSEHCIVEDRKSVVSGKSGSVSFDLGGGRNIK